MDQLDLYTLLEEDQHDPQIQYQMGLCYRYGYGIEIDENEAEYWFRLAAEQGHSEAKKILGEENQGEQNQTVTADNLLLWCNKAEEGDPDAQYAVACYFAGLDESQYREDIFHYLKQAAQQGHGYACWELGKRMASAKEYKKAVVYLEQAAECQISEAAQLLSYCYDHGLGVSRDIRISERILERDAELGNGFAKLRLAVRYELGNGVWISHVKAMAYLERARLAGVDNARELFDEQVAAHRKAQAEEEEQWQREQTEKRKRLQEEKAAEEARLQQEKLIREAQQWEEEQARLAKERWEQEQLKKKKRRRRNCWLAAACVACLLAAAVYGIIFYQPKISHTWNFDQSFMPQENQNVEMDECTAELIPLGKRNVAVFDGTTGATYSVRPLETKEDLTFTVDFYCKNADMHSTLVRMNPVTVTLDQGKLLVSCELFGSNNNPSAFFNMQASGIRSEEWYTLTVTLSSKKQAFMYLNGIKVAETEWTEKSRNLSKMYGTGMTVGNDGFCGAVANISVSNFPLSESEIKTDAAERLERLEELDDSALDTYFSRLQ